MCFMTWNFQNLLNNLVKLKEAKNEECLFHRYLHKAHCVPGLCAFININSLNLCNCEVDTIIFDILQKETKADARSAQGHIGSIWFQSP